MGECSLLPGVFGISVQLALAALVCLVLLLKKKLEDRSRRTRRTWTSFFLDCSKQLVGAGWVHLLNMASSMILGMRQTMGQCEWYLVNIFVDDTLGVFVEYLLLRRIIRLLERIVGDGADEYRSGSYHSFPGGEFQFSRYMKQLVVWLVVVTLMKVLMLVLVVLLTDPLHRVTDFFLWPLFRSPVAELLVVMIITPFFLNALQFWVVDNFIQTKLDNTQDLAQQDNLGDARDIHLVPHP